MNSNPFKAMLNYMRTIAVALFNRYLLSNVFLMQIFAFVNVFSVFEYLVTN